MNKIYWFIAFLMLTYLFSPLEAAAATVKTFSGTVTRIYGSGIYFTTASAASYSADIANAALLRKNGASMQFAEILVGDKVEVKGTLWADNGISPLYIKDLSLYAHKGSFSGKIIGINTADLSFILQSKAHGDQNIHTNNFTAFTKNGKNSGFVNLELGMSATVSGVWDRTSTNVIASNIAGSFRLIDIYFTGTLSIKNGSALTVVGNGNVIYGVDAGKAKVLSKNGKPMALDEYRLGDTIRVWGKHISGMVAVTASQVKDASVSK